MIYTATRTRCSRARIANSQLVCYGRTRFSTVLRSAPIAALAALLLSGAEHHGQVKFGGLPVPGATVTATQAGKTLTAITDPQGTYSFPDLADGAWTIQIDMLGFAPVHQEVTSCTRCASPEWDLKMLPLSEIHAVAAAGGGVHQPRSAASRSKAPNLPKENRAARKTLRRPPPTRRAPSNERM